MFFFKESKTSLKHTLTFDKQEKQTYAEYDSLVKVNIYKALVSIKLPHPACFVTKHCHVGRGSFLSVVPYHDILLSSQQV